MNAELLRILEQAKAMGIESIATDALIAYVRADETAAADPELQRELYKATLQRWLEEYKNAWALNIEMFRSAITVSQSALRTSLLMNGGASVSILTFIGHLVTDHSGKVPSLACSLAIFVTGVLSAALASGVTYLVGWFYTYKINKTNRVGDVLNFFAIGLWLASWAFFAFGAWKAYCVFGTWHN